MKKLILGLSIAFMSNAFATVDSNTNVFLLVRHVQSGEYFIERAPLVGCYGLPRGPQLAQLTRPYIVSNLGCGMNSKENINALACGKVVEAIEANDYSTFKKITLDISKCDEKNNRDFIHGIRKIVRFNFATKTNPRPVLVLLK